MSLAGSWGAPRQVAVLPPIERAVGNYVRPDQNRRAAEAAATARLADTSLPPGAQRIDGGSDIAIGRHPGQPPDSRTVAVTGWWLVPEPTGRVERWIRSHEPPGLVSVSTVTGGPSGRDIIAFQWNGGGRTYGSELALATAPAPGRETLLRAEAQADWLKPRSRADRVSARVTVAELTVVRPGHRRTSAIRRPQVVHHLVELLNSLVVPQWSGTIYGCLEYPPIPGKPSPPTIWLRLRAQSGAELAHFAAPKEKIYDPCDPLELVLSGGRTVSLAGGEQVLAFLRPWEHHAR